MTADPYDTAATAAGVPYVRIDPRALGVCLGEAERAATPQVAYGAARAAMSVGNVKMAEYFARQVNLGEYPAMSSVFLRLMTFNSERAFDNLDKIGGLAAQMAQNGYPIAHTIAGEELLALATSTTNSRRALAFLEAALYHLNIGAKLVGDARAFFSLARAQITSESMLNEPADGLRANLDRSIELGSVAGKFYLAARSAEKATPETREARLEEAASFFAQAFYEGDPFVTRLAVLKVISDGSAINMAKLEDVSLGPQDRVRALIEFTNLRGAISFDYIASPWMMEIAEWRWERLKIDVQDVLSAGPRVRFSNTLYDHIRNRINVSEPPTEEIFQALLYAANQYYVPPPDWVYALIHSAYIDTEQLAQEKAQQAAYLFNTLYKHEVPSGALGIAFLTARFGQADNSISAITQYFSALKDMDNGTDGAERVRKHIERMFLFNEAAGYLDTATIHPIGLGMLSTPYAEGILSGMKEIFKDTSDLDQLRAIKARAEAFAALSSVAETLYRAEYASDYEARIERIVMAGKPFCGWTRKYLGDFYYEADHESFKILNSGKSQNTARYRITGRYDDDQSDVTIHMTFWLDGEPRTFESFAYNPDYLDGSWMLDGEEFEGLDTSGLFLWTAGSVLVAPFDPKIVNFLHQHQHSSWSIPRSETSTLRPDGERALARALQGGMSRSEIQFVMRDDSRVDVEFAYNFNEFPKIYREVKAYVDATREAYLSEQCRVP